MRRSLSSRLGATLAVAVVLFMSVVAFIVSSLGRTGRQYERMIDRDIAAELLTQYRTHFMREGARVRGISDSLGTLIDDAAARAPLSHVRASHERLGERHQSTSSVGRSRSRVHAA